MSASDPKAHLQRYLQAGRDALLRKLDGLSSYDVRRPLVPTGTNLLGLLKHLSGVEMGYFGETFGRPVADPPAWMSNFEEANVDMWATAEESREEIIALYHRTWAHTDATIEALPLDAAGSVAHWPPERRTVTLHQILVHVIAETHRHAGHADLVRELIDGDVGMRGTGDNLPDGDAVWWQEYRDRLEAAARQADAQ